MSEKMIPVITIDGPSASGKGTVASIVAKKLGFHYLDSGALYRLVALAAFRENVALNDEPSLANLAAKLDVVFDGGEIWLGKDKVTDEVRSEKCGNGASVVAALPTVRAALLARQRDFCQLPGLVADGRDMGSVVFPAAGTKFYLTASAEVRAERRFKQLKEKGVCATIENILQDIQERDKRDSARSVAPLQKCADASLLDTTKLTIDEAVDVILKRFE